MSARADVACSSCLSSRHLRRSLINDDYHVSNMIEAVIEIDAPPEIVRRVVKGDF